MRKLIMWNIITLDGYFEGAKSWELPFHELIWGPELERISIEQLVSASCLIFGRITYEGMAAHWQSAEGEVARLMNSIPKFVFSGTLHEAEWENAHILNGNPVSEINQMKLEGEGDMYIFGSARLSHSLIQNKVFDEYRIGIAPVFLGEGRKLFEQGIAGRLAHTDTQSLSSGCVILKYKSL